MLSEKEILQQALSTLEGINIDIYNKSNKSERYNFQAIGRVMVIKRILAEMLSQDLNKYLLPGESVDEDSTPDDLQRFYSPIKNESLNTKEKMFLQQTVLPMINDVNGVNDVDDACLRCFARMIAEIAGYENLNKYRLMMENEVKSIYNINYKPVKIDVNQNKLPSV